MTTVRIDITDAQVVQAFNELGAKLGNLQPLMDELGALLESRVNLRFATKTDPAGRPWAEWAPSTAKRRRKEGRGTLLEYRRRMLDSLTHASGADFLEVGFGVDYAAPHEFGAHIQKAGHMREAHFKVDFKSGKSRFAKRSKANFEQWVSVPAHEIKIPARRMLTADGENLGEGDRAAIVARVRAWIEEAP